MKPFKDQSGGSSHTDPKLISTEDGSPTLYSSHFEATYHSLHGALQESIHVFINSGLLFHIEKNSPVSIRIFEMGFGTGLNAYLTASLCPANIHIEYHAIEKFPISLELVDQFAEEFSRNKSESSFDKQLFKQLHQIAWGESRKINDNFSLCLYNEDILKMDLPGEFDIFYFDAFGPGTQPELWSDRITEKLYQSCSPSACLVTYSAQGAFRRSLIHSGFHVDKIPGPPGKREMLRALKQR